MWRRDKVKNEGISLDFGGGGGGLGIRQECENVS